MTTYKSKHQYNHKHHTSFAVRVVRGGKIYSAYVSSYQLGIRKAKATAYKLKKLIILFLDIVGDTCIAEDLIKLRNCPRCVDKLYQEIFA